MVQQIQPTQVQQINPAGSTTKQAAKPVINTLQAKPQVQQPVQQQSNQEQTNQPNGENKWYTKWWMWVIFAMVIILVGFSVWYFFP